MATRAWLVLGFALGLCGCASGGPTDAPDDLWKHVSRGGYVLIVRHDDVAGARSHDAAISSGNCRVQQILSDPARANARRLKAALVANNVQVGLALTGHDCGCIELGGILFGRVQPWSTIDSAPDENADVRMEKRVAFREAISRWHFGDNLALVSHVGNILHVLDVAPAPDEMLAIEPMGDLGYRILGRLRAD